MKEDIGREVCTWILDSVNSRRSSINGGVTNDPQPLRMRALVLVSGHEVKGSLRRIAYVRTSACEHCFSWPIFQPKIMSASCFFYFCIFSFV